MISVEPNLNSYFNELMKFGETFETRVVRDKTGFSLRYHDMNSYEIPPCYLKRKSTAISCGIVDGSSI